MKGDFFVHPKGICESSNIGKDTRIWAFAHVLGNARIGADCNICDHVFIENDVFVGDRVTIKSGVQLWDGVKLGNDVFIGPNCTFTNDLFPRSKVYPEAFAETIVEDGASVGANATILAGTIIGRYAMVGAGAVVTRSVPPYAIVAGNPARIVGYVENADRTRISRGNEEKEKAFPITTEVRGVKLHRLPEIKDMRGSLTVADFQIHLPFGPARTFFVFDVPSREIRGEHAHRVCEQFLLCVKGSVSVMADDGNHRFSVKLDNPSLGIHLSPYVWASQYNYTPDAVLVVFASHPYDAEDYIRDYSEFLEESREKDLFSS